MKKIILSLIVVIAILAGGYFILPPEQINQFSQYVPKPISELLGIEEDAETNNELIPSDIIEESPAATSSSSLEETPIVQGEMLEPVVEIAKVEPVIETPVKSVTNDDIEELSSEIFENDSPEVIKIKKRLEKVKRLINTFEGTNATLQAQFDKNIKENKDLSVQLKSINDQLRESQ